MEGRNERIEIQIGNADRYWQSFLLSYNYLKGQNVTIWQVFDDDLTLASSIREDFIIDKSAFNAQNITLNLISKIAFIMTLPFPGNTFSSEDFPNVPKQDKIKVGN